jgi:hypothetical protein
MALELRDSFGCESTLNDLESESIEFSQAFVAHAYKPICLGYWDWEDYGQG